MKIVIILQFCLWAFSLTDGVIFVYYHCKSTICPVGSIPVFLTCTCIATNTPGPAITPTHGQPTWHPGITTQPQYPCQSTPQPAPHPTPQPGITIQPPCPLTTQPPYLCQSTPQPAPHPTPQPGITIQPPCPPISTPCPPCFPDVPCQTPPPGCIHTIPPPCPPCFPGHSCPPPGAPAHCFPPGVCPPCVPDQPCPPPGSPSHCKGYTPVPSTELPCPPCFPDVPCPTQPPPLSCPPCFRCLPKITVFSPLLCLPCIPGEPCAYPPECLPITPAYSPKPPCSTATRNPICPCFLCMSLCIDGYVLDENGCPTCICRGLKGLNTLHMF